MVGEADSVRSVSPSACDSSGPIYVNPGELALLVYGRYSADVAFLHRFVKIHNCLPRVSSANPKLTSHQTLIAFNECEINDVLFQGPKHVKVRLKQEIS